VPDQPLHLPKKCASCGADILWGQLLDEKGLRQQKPDGRYKAIPIDFAPVPNGNVLVFERAGQGIVCRVLKRGEVPPAGAQLRVSHFATCVNAAQHRRRA
jgi:hypothetical protein